MTDVTRILQAIGNGERGATEDLLPIVYDELRQIAAAKLMREKKGHTLQTTALVHEAYLRLVGGRPDDAASQSEVSTVSPNETQTFTQDEWRTRGHFFAAAAEAMRRILIESARSKSRLKRGGDRQRLDLNDVELAIPMQSVDLIALDEALTRLEAEDEVKAKVVKLRYFAGLTIEQTATALDVSEPTVKRYWYYSRAWLKREIAKGDESDE